MGRRVSATGRLALAAGFLLGVLACDSILREQVERLVDAYQVIRSEGVVYVDWSNGDDGNPGTRAEPRKTIQSGIDLADSLLDRGEVRVAEGTYTIGQTLVVKEGISLCGGYSAIDWVRDLTQHETMIQASGIDIALKPEEGVTAATAIDGLTIQAAWKDTAICIECEESSPTIRFCTLDASAGIEDSIGIYNKTSSAVIMANTIDAGSGSEAAWGIVNVSSPVTIRNNVIFGESGTGKYKGIYNYSGSDAVIQNNTIRAGTSSGDKGIYNVSSRCIIENNIVYASLPEWGCGIEEASLASLPQRVRNNDIHVCNPVYRHQGGSCDLAQMEAYLHAQGVGYSGNVGVVPLFLNESEGDWHLQSDSLVKDKGLALSAWFTTDRDGVTRIALWSMGAYETD